MPHDLKVGVCVSRLHGSDGSSVDSGSEVFCDGSTCMVLHLDDEPLLH